MTVPLHDIGAEEHVPGALLSAAAIGGAETAARVAESIEPTGLESGDFYRLSLGKIYEVELALIARGLPCDPVSLADELEQRRELEDVGGRPQLHALAALGATFSNVGHHAKIVRELAQRRRLDGRLRSLIEENANGGVRPETVRALVESIDASAQGEGARLEPTDLGTLLEGPPPEIAWLWTDWIARGDLALVVGDPKVGKSLLALTLAESVRRGEPFLGSDCARCRVGYFDLENPFDVAHARLLGVGLTSEEHDGLLYFHVPGVDLLTRPEPLAEAIERHDLGLTIIDSFRRAAPGLDENDSAAISAAVAPLRALTATSGRSIALIHHPRKRGGEQSNEAGQMVRGSGDLHASCDSLLYLRATEPGAFTLEHASSRRGLPHESILVRIESDGERIRLVNEGTVARAEDKVEATLARIVEALRDEGEPLARQPLAVRLGLDPKSGTYSRALNLGWQRELLAKTDGTGRQPTLYALAPEVTE